MFTDDPKLTPGQISRIAGNRGGGGISTPLMRDGVWHVSRDIHLGQDIPGYRTCDLESTPLRGAARLRRPNSN